MQTNGVESIKLPYTQTADGLTDHEIEVQLNVEGLTVRAFVPRSKIDFKQRIIHLFVFGNTAESSVIELPGEPLNSSRRLKVSKRWLEETSVK